MAKDLLQNKVNFETVIQTVFALKSEKNESLSGSSIVSSDNEIFVLPKTISESVILNHDLFKSLISLIED